jgi:hypothetical protein
MRLAFVVHLEINADCVRAFFVFADIFERELFPSARLLFLRVVCVGDERFAPLDFRQRLEEVDDRF